MGIHSSLCSMNQLGFHSGRVMVFPIRWDALGLGDHEVGADVVDRLWFCSPYEHIEVANVVNGLLVYELSYRVFF